MPVNRRHMSLREGKVFIDGEQVMDAVKFSVNFTPEVAESQSLGKYGKDRRWIARDITGTMTEYKSTPWLKDAIMKYEDTGATPEFTFQGIQDDENSDYYDNNGSDVITCRGCVLTGDIPLLSMDTEGELVQDEISFGVHSIV